MKYILIILDIYTKYVSLYQLRSVNTDAVIKEFTKYHFPQYYYSKGIKSDNATQLISKDGLIF